MADRDPSHLLNRTNTLEQCAISNDVGEHAETATPSRTSELVILTGLSGAGKQSALRTFEDLGYYAVDNLPLDLVAQFAALLSTSTEINKAVLVVDAREGTIERFPQVLEQVATKLDVRVVFLEASEAALIKRYSETRRPHPAGTDDVITESIASERKRMSLIRSLADVILDTSYFNVHELRAHLSKQFSRGEGKCSLSLSIMSFGFKNGVPPQTDMLFDVRFLPNPHFVPEFRPLTGLDTQVADYVTSFPESMEFLQRVSNLLNFLLPYFEKEGKSYLTVAFGCTGGQHRSVAVAEYMRRVLASAEYSLKVTHRDLPRGQA